MEDLLSGPRRAAGRQFVLVAIFFLFLIVGFSSRYAYGQHGRVRHLAATVKKGMTAQVASPSTGSHIYMFAIPTTGYGSPPFSLIATDALGAEVDSSGNAYVLTDSSGNFSITDGNFCPSVNSFFYILSVGGDPGTGINNPYMTLMALIPSQCTPNWTVDVTETTTLAAAYAIGAFATYSTSSFATDSNSTAALAAAVSYSNSLINTANAVIPSNAPWLLTLNTLGDILAECDDSMDPVDDCATLFQTVALPNGPIPTNTLQAALSIASNPSLYLLDEYFGMPSPFLPAFDYDTFPSFNERWTLPGGSAQVGGANIVPSSTSSTVTIVGSGFGATQGSSVVVIGGTQATIQSWSDAEIVAIVPNANAASGNIQVLISGGQASNLLAISAGDTTGPLIVGTPAGTSPLSLSQGPQQMGFIINGINFGATQGFSYVGIRLASDEEDGYDELLKVLQWSNNSITVQIPSNYSLLGANEIFVRVGGQLSNAQSSNSVPFTVTAPFGCSIQ